MKLGRSVFFLIITIVIVPALAFYYSDSLTVKQWGALYATGKIAIGLAIACFVVGEITGNTSQVDKVWSIAPVVYVWNIAYLAGFSERALLMAILVSIWGIRLTYNFGRRGGYSWKFWTGEEDYRWEVLRNGPVFKGNRILWSLFNLFFISGYQMLLIFLFSLPIILEIDAINSGINYIDLLAVLFMLIFIILEAVADQQHYVFQTEKYRKINAGEKLEGIFADGFLKKGLWGKMRHPNYAGEQGTWLSFYLFSVAATGQWINWTIVGAVLLVVLFKSSSDFSESITLGKYPKYKEYQAKVPKFFPKLF